MNSNFKIFFHRLEAAISITILLLACQQLSALEQHKQNIVTQSPTKTLLNFQLDR